MVLRGGNAAAERAVHRHRDRDTDREPAVDERDRRRPSAGRTGAASRRRGAAPSAAHRTGSRRETARSSQPAAAPQASAAEASAYASSEPPARRASSGRAGARKRPASRSRASRSGDEARRANGVDASSCRTCSAEGWPLGSRPAMAEKRYLLTPGPTPVPPQVLAAMAQPIVHHRGPDFRRCLSSAASTGSRRSSGPSATCSSSRRRGPAGWSRPSRTSARRANACVVVSAGYFGERWAEIADGLRRRGRPSSATSGARRRRRTTSRRASPSSAAQRPCS